MHCRSFIGLLAILTSSNFAYAASDICDAFYQEAKSEKACFAYAAYAKKCGDHAYISFAEEYLARNCDGEVIERKAQTSKIIETIENKTDISPSDKKVAGEEIMRKCDLLAAPPTKLNNYNPFNVPGVPMGKLTDTGPAIAACITAVKAFPNNSRFRFQLGRAYSAGKRYKLAIKTYEIAAERGNADAQSNLGFMYEHGQGVDKNDQKAAKLYRQAAEQGDMVGQYNLGLSYFFGRGVPEDENQSVIWFTRSAEGGYSNARYRVGNAYAGGLGVSKNAETAVFWYKKSAEQDQIFAQFELAAAYQNGFGVSKDMEKAEIWYTKSAEQGNPGAQFNLGEILESKLENICDEAASRFAIENSDMEHQVAYDTFLEDCLKNHESLPVAFAWFKKSAEQGLAGGQYKTGMRYAKGKGVTQDYSSAIQWLKKAAAEGVSSAYLQLGEQYRYGKGTNKNPLEAVTMFLKSKALGNQYADNYVEVMYSDGFGNQYASKIQRQLKNLGFYDGKIDGNFGSASKAALKAYCKC